MEVASRIRGLDWDMSAIGTLVHFLLARKPNSSTCLFATTECCNSQNVPVIVAMSMRNDWAPPHCLQDSEGNLSSIDDAGFRWSTVRVNAGAIQGQIKVLTSSGGGSETSSNLYYPSARHLDKADNVDFMEIPYTDIDGTKKTAIWRRDGNVSMNKLLGRIADDMMKRSGIQQGRNFDRKRQKLYKRLKWVSLSIPLKYLVSDFC